jgi:hypothetical protein
MVFERSYANLLIHTKREIVMCPAGGKPPNLVAKALVVPFSEWWERYAEIQ